MTFQRPEPCLRFFYAPIFGTFQPSLRFAFMRSLLTSFFLLASAHLFGQTGQMAFDLSAPEVETLPKGAQWMVSLHDANGALLQQFPFPASALKQRVVIGPRRMGTYTASYYLDLNGNNELDKGLFGQPLEPYAFSNGARSMFSRPDVASQRFTHNGRVIPVKLEYHFGG